MSIHHKLLGLAGPAHISPRQVLLPPPPSSGPTAAAAAAAPAGSAACNIQSVRLPAASATMSCSRGSGSSHSPAGAPAPAAACCRWAHSSSVCTTALKGAGQAAWRSGAHPPLLKKRTSEPWGCHGGGERMGKIRSTWHEAQAV